MGIFSKITDILNSNINAILDKAQDPVKMSKLMIQEMEDTLVEIKSSIAEVLADKKRIERSLAARTEKKKEYEAKAKLAVDKKKDDLARKILEQIVILEGEINSLKSRDKELGVTVAEYRKDLTRLEEKLAEAKQKQIQLYERFKAARIRKKVEEKLYSAKTAGGFKKFEQLEKQLDHLQAQGEVVNMGIDTLDKEIETMEMEDIIEKKIRELKAGKSS
jgi:phage shock protein A